MKNIIPVVMAGVLGIYGLIISVILIQSVALAQRAALRLLTAATGNNCKPTCSPAAVFRLYASSLLCVCCLRRAVL
jgi:hypothetical protein